MLNVLVVCEESQAVANAFRVLGHNAFSCDLQMCSGGHPEYHIQGDCLSLLNGHCDFITCNGDHHHIDSEWDIIIAHPPCTYLTVAGSCRLYKNGILDMERVKLGYQAADFFYKIYNCNCKHIMIENPRPIGYFGLPPHSQHIEPYQFGHPYSKRTYLWLVGLPLLIPTCYVSEYTTCMESEWFNKGSNRAKSRSKTFQGIAEAIAAQYSAFVLGNYQYDLQLTFDI